MDRIDSRIVQNIYKYVFNGVLVELQEKTNDWRLFLNWAYTNRYTEEDYKAWQRIKFERLPGMYAPHMDTHRARFFSNKVSFLKGGIRIA